MDMMNAPVAWLEWTGVHLSPWKLIGLTGALMFGTRWAVQFLASRSAGRPVIPRAFWVMSLAGSAMTLGYFLFSQKQDAVGVLQNLFPAFTAGYSLWLDLRHGRSGQRPILDPVRLEKGGSVAGPPAGQAPNLLHLARSMEKAGQASVVPISNSAACGGAVPGSRNPASPTPTSR